MEFEFWAEVVEWRGPAPFIFAILPEDVGDEVKAMAKTLSYGWGCIPVTARIGDTEFTTALMPRQGRYLLPLKVVVQRAEGIELGASVLVILQLS